MNNLLLVIGIFVLVSLITSVNAANTNYVSTQTGNWDDPLTWNPNGIPEVTDKATIQSTHVVTLNSIETIGGGAGTSLNVQGDIVVNGDLTLQGDMILEDGSSFNMGPGSSLNLGGFNVQVNGQQTINLLGSIANRITVFSTPRGGAFMAGTNQQVDILYADFSDLGFSEFEFGSSNYGLNMTYTTWTDYDSLMK